jgi:hypothetical protein
MKNIIVILLMLFVSNVGVAEKVVVIPLFGNDGATGPTGPSREIIVTDQNDSFLGLLIQMAAGGVGDGNVVMTEKGYRYTLTGGTGELHIRPRVFYSGASCSGSMYIEAFANLNGRYLPGEVFAAWSTSGAAYLPFDAQTETSVSILSETGSSVSCSSPSSLATMAWAQQVFDNNPSVTGAPFVDGANGVPPPIKIKLQIN